MKQTTEHDYRNRVLKVIEYIGCHLDKPLALATLADLANFSPFHFHRIFRSIVGETLANHIRHQRLDKAAIALRQGSTVLSTALDNGYESPESFSRSFKSLYGVSPKAYVQMPTPPERPSTYSNIARGPNGLLLILPASFRSLNMKVEIITLNDIHIAYISHTGSYMEIGSAFERIIGWAATNGYMNEHTMTLGRYYDDPHSVETDQLRSEACVEIPAGIETGEDIKQAVIPGGLYAKTRFQGPYDQLIKAYDFLYGTWMPGSGKDVGDSPCVEVYLNNPGDTAPQDLLTEIYIPLKM